jgi:hypothetical protein
MDHGFIDSIDIVIADVTSQPLTSTAPQVLQRAGAVNLSASSVTIVPRPNSSMGQSPISSHSQTSFQAPMKMRALSSDSISSVGDGVMPHGQVVDGKQVKETKEYNDEEIIIEALRSAKDRLFMLKLGDSMENLIAERQYVFCHRHRFAPYRKSFPLDHRQKLNFRNLHPHIIVYSLIGVPPTTNYSQKRTPRPR